MTSEKTQPVVFEGRPNQIFFPDNHEQISAWGLGFSPGIVKRLAEIGKFRVYQDSIGGIGQSASFRAETKARGELYWYAYRRIEGTLKKVYVCRAKELDFPKIVAAADRLREMWKDA